MTPANLKLEIESFSVQLGLLLQSVYMLKPVVHT